MNLIDKEKSHAFGKDVYLIGIDTDGIKYWLEAPKWDCSWYWGFGYVETYQRNVLPSKAKDINSHTHMDGYYGKQEFYDHEKQCFRLGSDYIHTLWDNPKFAALTLNEGDQWKLSELFKSFYLLREMANYYHTGGAHITTISNLDRKNLNRWKELNTIEIPQIMEQIIKLLSPESESENINIPKL